MSKARGKQIIYAESLIERAEGAYCKAKDQLEEPAPSYPKAYSEAQEALELYTKAIIQLLVGKFPRRHGFTDEEIREVIREAEPPDDWIYADRLPRFLHQTKIWSAFYKEAKYGYEDLRIGPEEIIGEPETRAAFEHTKESRWAAKNLLNLMKYK